jgi:hypothetical protein
MALSPLSNFRPRPQAYIQYTCNGSYWDTAPPTDWTYVALPRGEFEGLQRGFQCLKEAVTVYSDACSEGDNLELAALLDTNRKINTELERLREVLCTTRGMLHACAPAASVDEAASKSRITPPKKKL